MLDTPIQRKTYLKIKTVEKITKSPQLKNNNSLKLNTLVVRHLLCTCCALVVQF